VGSAFIAITNTKTTAFDAHILRHLPPNAISYDTESVALAVAGLDTSARSTFSKIELDSANSIVPLRHAAIVYPQQLPSAMDLCTIDRRQWSFVLLMVVFVCQHLREKKRDQRLYP
jgi:hypothetical protein